MGEGARLQLGRHAAGGGVVGLVARGDRERRAGAEVVRQRDERHPGAALGWAVGEAGERVGADADVHAVEIGAIDAGRPRRRQRPGGQRARARLGAREAGRHERAARYGDGRDAF